MRKTAKRILSAALALAVLLGLGVTASAAQQEYVEVGETIRLYPPFSNVQDVWWDVRDTSVLSIAPSPDGMEASVTGLRAGSTSIDLEGLTGDGETLTAQINVTVTETAQTVFVELSRSSLTLTEGESESIGVRVEGYDGGVKWSSSDSYVAYVDSYGNVTANSPGSAVITARAGSESDSCAVTVTAARTEPLTARVSSQLVMNEGDRDSLSAQVSGGTGRYTYQWYSDNNSVLTVSGSGATASLNAVGSGTTRVNLEVNDGSDTVYAVCTVVVNAKARPTVATYSATGNVAAGTSLAINPIANAIADQFRRQLGESLDYGADVYLSNPQNELGAFTSNGGRIGSGSLAFVMFESAAFDAYQAGTFATTYTIRQGELSIGGQITITVTGGTAVKSASLDASSLSMATYSTRYLSLSVNPSNASADVVWSSDNNGVASVSGSGRSATVTTYGRAGSAVITATVTDGSGKRVYADCKVSVSSSANYDPTLSVTLDSDYRGTELSDNMARQFRDVFGYNLTYSSATIRFSDTGNSRYGVLRLSNGRAISANTSYRFSDWANTMYFEPVSVGTFRLPYTVDNGGDSLSGTLSIYIRGADVTAKLSATSLSLATFSNQDLSLTVTPSNARYSVSWSSSNTNIVTVSGNSATGRVETRGNTGTATVTARVTDANGVSVSKQCTVTVTGGASYDPSVSTYLGVSYTGTGTSDAMIRQFRNVYGVSLNTNSAVIRFSSTGNNGVAVMRLKDGSAIRANTNYTMAQYIQMYCEPLSVGTFSLPYTLTYNGQSLSGSVKMIVNAAAIQSALELSGTDAYAFSKAAANGVVGSTLLGSAVTNAVGSSWSYLRFAAPSSSAAGTLYRDSSRAALGSANIRQSDLGSLYFVPTAAGGTVSIPFTVFNGSGGAMANGSLSVTVKTAAAASVSFADIDPNNAAQKWVVEPVRWAVSRGITNGMSTDRAGRPQFEPNTTCNNAQIITFLWRSQGSPAPSVANPYRDVSESSYFYNAALWAYEKGVVSGSAFGEKTPCTRAMAVTYLWRLAGKPAAATANFGDVPGSGETSAAVAWAVSKGVTNGMGSDATGRPTFQPDATCTRGQIVTFLQRAYG